MTVVRQPVHTVLGGAHLFHAGVVERFRAHALEALETYAPDAATFGAIFGIVPDALADSVQAKVREKLMREPIEDYRIDFEDGYGVRGEDEEDGHAVAAAREVAAGLAAGSLPWRVGIRVKSPAEAERRRSERTLRLFLATLVGETGRMPPNFVVTLPKVTSLAQLTQFAATLAELEREFALATGALRFEVMIETPQIVLGADGVSPLPALERAGDSRLDSAIFGAYDFTAALGIVGTRQVIRHPACDFARHMMLVALAGSGVRLSDGATAVLPVAAHAARDGHPLTAAQLGENRRGVHAAWALHHGNVRHALEGGFHQGWDLHPAQLVSRFAATFAFFLEGLDAASGRLRNFVAKAARATRVGAAFDDAATGRGLARYLLGAVSAGAVTEAEVAERCGLGADALHRLAG